MKIGDIVILEPAAAPTSDAPEVVTSGPGLIIGFEEVFENEYEPIVFWSVEYPCETEYASQLTVVKL